MPLSVPLSTCLSLSLSCGGVLVYVSYRLTICSSVQSLSRVRLFATPWTAARRASLSITSSWSLSKLMSIELVMPSSHLILCRPLLLLPSIFPNIRVFSNESALLPLCRVSNVIRSSSMKPLSQVSELNYFQFSDWFSKQMPGRLINVNYKNNLPSIFI